MDCRINYWSSYGEKYLRQRVGRQPSKDEKGQAKGPNHHPTDEAGSSAQRNAFPQHPADYRDKQYEWHIHQSPLRGRLQDGSNHDCYKAGVWDPEQAPSARGWHLRGSDWKSGAEIVDADQAVHGKNQESARRDSYRDSSNKELIYREEADSVEWIDPSVMQLGRDRHCSEHIQNGHCEGDEHRQPKECVFKIFLNNPHRISWLVLRAYSPSTELKTRTAS